MKTFALSAVTVLAMSTFAMAGGDIAPVEPVMEEVVLPDESGFYVGLAYGYADLTNDYDSSIWGEGKVEDNFNTIMLQAGYKFNQYFSVEGRYWGAVGDGDWTDKGIDWNDSGSDSDFSAWGVYVKPMYPVTEVFDVYALLGYGNVDYDSGSIGELHDLDDEGFQWGLGGSYEFTDNFAVFADYVSLYDDDRLVDDGGRGENQDYEIYTVDVGITYKF